jgi:Acetyltransferases
MKGKQELLTNVRRATNSDINRIAEIIVFTKRLKFRSIFNDDNYLFNTLNVVAVSEETAQRKIENIFVYDDGIVKGMLYFQDVSITKSELCELYVDACFERNGIGQSLIKYYEQQCERKRIEIIELWSIEKNIAANMFYEAMNYKRTDEKRLIEKTSEYEVKYSRKIL